MQYLIYGLIDPRTDELRYVGQSEVGLRRPLQHWSKRGLLLDDYCHRWIKTVISSGEIPEIVVIEQFEEISREGLDDAERFWIAYYRSIGCRLTNMTDGGRGGTRGTSLEVRKKFSHPGKRNPFYGRKHSAEALELMSRNRQGIPSWRRYPVVCVNDNKRYESATAAAKAYDVNVNLILRICHGIQQKTKGYLRFRFV